jgi:hypothetical protein
LKRPLCLWRLALAGCWVANVAGHPKAKSQQQIRGHLMQPLQGLRRPGVAATPDAATVHCGCLKALFADLTRGFGNSRHDPISRLRGEAWTDSLERELNSEMAIRRGLNI